MTSTRPYLVRAFYQWIIDNQLTPYIVVNAERKDVIVPRQYVNDGRIIFNIAPSVVQTLSMDNFSVDFDARFSGRLMHVHAPISAVLAIYAKENGRGMVFEHEEDDDSDSGSHGPPPPNPPPRGKKPKLTVVK